MQNFRLIFRTPLCRTIAFSLRKPMLIPPNECLSAHNLGPRSPYSQSFQQRKFPEILYVPKLFRWLNTKIKLKYLQKVWDPDFTEGSFIYGSTQAISRITEIIHRNEPQNLDTLMTKSAQFRLKTLMDGGLTDMQRKIINLKPYDIKLLVPIKVQLIKGKDDEKKCFILLKSLSMKWHEERGGIRLILVVIDTEFSRDYTKGAKPEWFVSLFNIVQCALIGGSRAPMD